MLIGNRRMSICLPSTPPPHPVLLPLFKNALTLGGAGVRYGSHDTTEMQKDIM